jgi:diguanylate cyclase (GGDEF)-like protein
LPSQSLHDCIGDLQESLLRARLFRNVPEQLVTTVLKGCQTRQLSATETLLRAGTENDVLYIIVSGQVSVRVPGVDEPHVHLGTGECVGELSILDGQQVSADVVADAPTLVLALDRERLWSLIDASADVARNLLGILAGRVRADDAALGESGREQRQLQRLVTVDSLTGLRNRRWLDDAFARQLSRATRANQPLSLLMIDIDRFKQVNDTYGHHAGDAVLRRVAHTLATGLRPQDSLARYGGEEFTVVLPGLGRQQAFQVAERLRLAIQASDGDSKRENVTQITVSIGVATATPHESLATLLQRADEALYRAKESGRNCTRD